MNSGLENLHYPYYALGMNLPAALVPATSYAITPTALTHCSVLWKRREWWLELLLGVYGYGEFLMH
jgi:hypothetical protein